MTPAPLPSMTLSAANPAATRARLRPPEPVQPLQATRPAGGNGAGASFSDDPFARVLESRREASRLEERRQQERTADPARSAPPAPRSPGAASTVESDRPGADDAARDEPAAASRRPAPDNSGSSGVQRRWPDTRAWPARTAGPATGSAAGPAAPAETTEAAETTTPEFGPSGKARGAAAADLAEPPVGSQPPGADPRAHKAGLMPVECPLLPPETQARSGGVPGSEAQAEGRPETARLQTAAEAAAAASSAAGRPAPEPAADVPGQAPAWGAAPSPEGADAQAAHGAAAADASVAPAARPAAAPNGEAAVPPALAGLASPTAGEARASAAAAPAAAAQAQLPAAPGHPAFPAQLAGQLSIWVRAGIQQAQLHLNPAELGPVQVAIALEGSAAQVRLVAEHATTRQALEQALPALAGQLAEAGLMLSGGGVFDQASPRDGAAQAAANTQRGRTAGAATRADEPASGAMPGATALRPRGLVDLLA